MQDLPAIISGRIITAADGRQYSVLTITDISNQKHVEEELRRANAQLEQRQKEIEEELALAARVQQSLVPASLVWGRVAVEAYYSPVHSVGGDFGLVLPHNDELLSLLVCDVSGHGIASALVANPFTRKRCTNSNAKPDPAACCNVCIPLSVTRLGCRAFTSRQPQAALSSTGGE